MYARITTSNFYLHIKDDPLMRSPLIRETLEKLDEQKQPEDTKPPEKLPVKLLILYSKMIDRNSIFALKAALPMSQIHTLKFSNNGFTWANFEYLVNAISASKVSRVFIDWNPIPKKEIPKPELPPETHDANPPEGAPEVKNETNENLKEEEKAGEEAPSEAKIDEPPSFMYPGVIFSKL